jgi:eukaryotic-like serine/threonine-protein kinase
MPLPAGYRLGPYEVLSLLGTGGMGQVYCARDSRLEREVAIKVLPDAFVADRDRLIRFEREARAASSLEHPNIVTIHEIGESGGRHFLVMEKIQGRTLREGLAAGPLPLRQTLQTAAQVADGLAAAHERGIVHRDVKPENVMITREGRVKILDFGLAKLSRPEEGAANRTEAPTVSAATEPGAVMGTVAYMSPEQARGEAVDFRSDQFSLGSMVFEMATGRRAFERNTRAETLTAIIREEPAFPGLLGSPTPAPLRWTIERCLSKDPDHRYVSTRDLARELATLRDHFGEASLEAEPSERLSGRHRSRRRNAIIGLGILAAVALSAFLLGRHAGWNPPPTFQRLTFRRGYVWSARFAPDGKTIVYGAAWDGEPVRLYSTRPENPESLPLNLPSADILSISSEGEMAISLDRHFVQDWLTYGKLARVPLSGTAPRDILDKVLSADWAPSGDAIAIVRDIGRRTRLEFPVGKVLYETTGWITTPRVSPDGKLVAFLDHPVRWGDGGDVAVVDLSGRKTTLSSGWSSNQGLAWSQDARELWFTASTLGFARDLHAVSLSGKSRIVARLGDNLTLHDVSRDGHVLLSRDRVRAGVMGRFPGDTRERDLSWLDVSIVTDLSSDGGRVLFHEMKAGKAPAACIRKTDGSPPVRLGDGFPTALSSDGRSVLCVTDQLTILPTGTGEARPLMRGMIRDYWWAGFLPSGRILSAASEEGRGIRLYLQDENGSPRPVSEEGIDVEIMDIAISHSGDLVAAVGPVGKILLYPVSGGAPRELPGTMEGDAPVQWSTDDASLFVVEREKLPAPVFRIDLSSGDRKLWNELIPSDPAGVNVLLTARMTPDGKSYAYSYGQVLSEMSLVDGLK